MWTLTIRTYARQDDIEANYARKDEIGNIESALNAIIEIQNSLIGGDGE